MGGPRGLRPHEPLTLVRDGAGGLVVETGGRTFAPGTADSLVLTALAAHDGRLDTPTLVRDLAGTPGLGLDDLARGIAVLVRDGVLDRTAAGPGRRRVRVVAVGDVEAGACRDALAAGGLREVADDADLAVVLCRDHRTPELVTALRGCSNAGPTLLVRLGTARCWIGPLLPGDQQRSAGAPPVGDPVTGGRPEADGPVRAASSATTASCPDCLLESLRRNASGEPRGVGVGTVVPAGPGAVLARAAAGLVAAAVDAVLDRLEAPGPDPDHGPWPDVREVDLRTLTATSHPVRPCPHHSPGCPHHSPGCPHHSPGSPAAGPVDPVPEGDPVASARDFLRRTAPLVSTVTGVLAPVVTVPVGAGAFLAATTHLVRWRAGPGEPARWVRAQATAVAADPDTARAAATGEALERFSASWHGDEDAVRAPAAQLLARPGARVLLPQDLGHHSAEQVAAGAGPPPLGSDVVTDFLPLRRWTGREDGPVHVAAGAVLFGHPDDEVSRCARPDSNGCAVGASLDAAVLAGALELLERDAVARWWWPRRERLGVDPAVLGVARAGLEAELGRRGRTLRLLDVTSDVGVPVVVAVGARTDGTGIRCGFGAHPDRARAAGRAVRELLQVLVLQEQPDGRTPDGPTPGRGGPTPGWDAVHLDDAPFLRPHGLLPTGALLPTGVGGPSRPVGDDLAQVRRSLQAAGVETFVLDLTRAATGVPAVRVVAPVLRPWYRRLGPGRLVLPDGPNPWDLPV